MTSASLARLRRGETVPLHQYFGDMRSSYALGRPSRFLRRRTNMPVNGAGADYHLGSEADVLRRIETAQDIVNEDMVVGSAIRGLAANVLQGGYTCDHDTGSKELDKLLKDDWLAWSENPDRCDLEQEHDLHDLIDLAFQSAIATGDQLLSFTEEDNIQTFEAHRLRTPRKKVPETHRLAYGIHTDERRRRVAYWVTQTEDTVSSTPRISDLARLPARDENGHRLVAHLYLCRRKSATRGVSALVPIGALADQHNDINFAKLVQQQIVSCYAILRERKFPPVHGKASGPRKKQGEQTEDPASPDGFRRLIEKLYPGMEVIGEEGEELKGFSPNVPNVEYFDHVRLMLAYIAINLDLPLIMLLMDARETNFSGWRGAMDQAKLRMRRMQKWVRNQIYVPTYRWRVRRLLETNARAAKLAAGIRDDGSGPVDPYDHLFQLPSWPYIQPVDDIKADILQVQHAQNSPRRVQMARARDWPTIVEELVADNELLIGKAMEAADRLRDRYTGYTCDWREVISVPTPDNVSASLRLADVTANQNTD